LPVSDNQTINNTEALRSWFRQCPILQAGKRFGVDYLSDSPTEYAIFASPSTLSYHENVLGEEVPNDEQTLNFIFASRVSFSEDVRQNLDTLGFYEAVVVWITEQNAARNFPSLSCGKVKSILPTLTAYPAEVGTGAAKYQIQIKMTYRRNT